MVLEVDLELKARARRRARGEKLSFAVRKALDDTDRRVVNCRAVAALRPTITRDRDLRLDADDVACFERRDGKVRREAAHLESLVRTAEASKVANPSGGDALELVEPRLGATDGARHYHRCLREVKTHVNCDARSLDLQRFVRASLL